ncbi:unnamed protein product [Sphagnum jensenii]|uniref:Bms1-type G domain-containing protein n=1 Tax=Sphagnum jensenii TaxID=128206 RepID=A0ABP1AXD7_9BRYO
MAGGRTQKNKAHKTRFASKSSRNAHKVSGEKSSGKGAGKGPARRAIPTGQTVRDLRLQRNKNIRDQKRAGVLAEKRASSSSTSAPRILALVPLSSMVNVESLKVRLLTACNTAEAVGQSVEAMDTDASVFVENKDLSLSTVSVPRLKLRLTVIEAPHDDLQACLEVVKVADIVAFVVGPALVAGEDDGFIDQAGKKSLSMLRAQGLPVTTGLLLVMLTDVPMKKRSDAKKSTSVALQAELPENSKIYSSDTIQECQQLLRHLANQRLATPLWRTQRPFILAQQLEYEVDPLSPEVGTLRLSGYVRARALSVNQLVHVAGVGDFQLSQVDTLEDPCPIHQQQKQAIAIKGNNMLVEEKNSSSVQTKGCIAVAVPNVAVQESVIVENTPDALAGEQTWPTEEELMEASNDEKTRLSKKKKKLLVPRGTSDYQAAWIVDDEFEEKGEAAEDEDEEEAMEGGVSLDEEAMEAESEDDDDDTDKEGSVISEQGNGRLGLSSRATSVWEGEIDDRKFPDEVDTPTDVPARQRFAKYRGLKSLRTSPWDPKESLPWEYARIFAFENFVHTQKNVFARAKQNDTGVQEGCMNTGLFVRLHVKNVPAAAAARLLGSYNKIPVVACGLLQHESKMSVLHFSVRKNESYMEPIKSKDDLIFHTGFRQYHTRPIFSTDDLNMDKHKFERFLHPGRFVVASIFAPISFPPLPLLVFKEATLGDRRGAAGAATLVASGSLRSVDPDRIILKKITLSGYPHRVSKRKAVVRFMFHNPEDVRWFKPLELWTKYGRRGRIREPVGTHGSMKCIFDGVVQQRDAVCVSLFKRVYPKWPQHLLAKQLS